MPKRYQVFICHSSKDRAVADQVYAALNDGQRRPWMAPHDVRVSEEYAAAIIRAIGQCEVMLLLLTPAAIASAHVHREIERACDRGVPIVPFRLGGTMATGALEYFLSGTHAMDAAYPPSQSEIAELVRSIKHLCSDAAEVVTAPEQQAWPHQDPQRRGGNRFRMPVQLTKFIGREHEISKLRGLLQNTRLLTLTGVGGCGKTRLALRLVEELNDEFAGKSAFVDLSSISEPALTWQAVESGLGLPPEQNTDSSARVIGFLAEGEFLLVIDNCEQIIDACAHVTEELLISCPALKIIATSREVLNISGEVSFRVPSMSTPAGTRYASMEALLQHDAVRLFIDRAMSANEHFSIQHEDVMSIARICSRLDGIPLAIELGAARVRTLSVTDIEQRLDHRFQLLTAGRRTALPRQRTMETAVDWSFNLLPRLDQEVLARCSVFDNGWTVAAAEEVCSGVGVPREQVMDVLAGLVDKSLILFDELERQGRYRVLQTIRDYGWAKLTGVEDKHRIRDRHLEYFYAFVQRTVCGAGAPDAAFDRLEREHENIRAALDHSMESGKQRMFLELCASLWRFWEVRGYLIEGQAYLTFAIENTEDDDPLPLVLAAHVGLGNILAFQGEYTRAGSLLERALSAAEKAGDTAASANILQYLANVRWNQSQLEEAGALYERSQTLGKVAGNMPIVARALEMRANIARVQHRLGDAEELLRGAVEIYRSLGDALGTAWSALGLANIYCSMRLHEQARPLLRDALRKFLACHYGSGVAFCLERCAHLMLQLNDPASSAAMFGLASSIREEVGSVIPEVDRTEFYDTDLKVLSAGLGDLNLKAAWARGAEMTPQKALELLYPAVEERDEVS